MVKTLQKISNALMLIFLTIQPFNFVTFKELVVR